MGPLFSRNLPECSFFFCFLIQWALLRRPLLTFLSTLRWWCFPSLPKSGLFLQRQIGCAAHSLRKKKQVSYKFNRILLELQQINRRFTGWLTGFCVSAGRRCVSINSLKRKVMPDRNVLPKGICWTMPSMSWWVLEFTGEQPNAGGRKGGELKHKNRELLQGTHVSYP